MRRAAARLDDDKERRPMSGERDLTKLLQHMTPSVHPEIFAFCHFSDFQLPSTLTPIATFREVEGLTAVVPMGQAQALGIDYQFESRMVTLTVHSSLDAVGFLAHITTGLATQGISCNVVSAYHHDHLFFQKNRLSDALRVLDSLTRGGSSTTSDGADEQANTVF
jgi:uncharacterized protein